MSAFLEGSGTIEKQKQISFDSLKNEIFASPDMAQIKGQGGAKRALEVAAAGGHNMIMIGVPGSGKTMLARCLPGILPPLSFEEALEIIFIVIVSKLLLKMKLYIHHYIGLFIFLDWLSIIVW